METLSHSARQAQVQGRFQDVATRGWGIDPPDGGLTLRGAQLSACQTDKKLHLGG